MISAFCRAAGKVSKIPNTGGHGNPQRGLRENNNKKLTQKFGSACAETSAFWQWRFFSARRHAADSATCLAVAIFILEPAAPSLGRALGAVTAASRSGRALGVLGGGALRQRHRSIWARAWRRINASSLITSVIGNELYGFSIPKSMAIKKHILDDDRMVMRDLLFVDDDIGNVQDVAHGLKRASVIVSPPH